MSQRYALVTGCGKGGIGEALVTEYARSGLHAIATVLPSESSEHLVKAGITSFPLDVTSEESIVSLKTQLQKLTNGKLDILVNNAVTTTGYTMPAIDTDVTAVQHMFNVNVFGPMRMVHHFHDMLIRSSGTILNMGSIGAVIPYVYGSSYNAAKAALTHWGNTLRVEMAPLDCGVSLTYLQIIAGEVGTNILKNDHGRQLPEGSYYTPLAAAFDQHVHRTPATTDRYEFARGVVAKSLHPSPPIWLWYGSQTRLTWFLDTFFPRAIFDWLLWYIFSLGKLQLAHRDFNKRK
ncbi:NAD(P)-binding protein [Nemania abortiva]|nr:NAD(P)-binding protein [Nemania abortiva]